MVGTTQKILFQSITNLMKINPDYSSKTDQVINLARTIATILKKAVSGNKNNKLKEVKNEIKEEFNKLKTIIIFKPLHDSIAQQIKSYIQSKTHRPIHFTNNNLPVFPPPPPPMSRIPPPLPPRVNTSNTSSIQNNLSLKETTTSSSYNQSSSAPFPVFSKNSIESSKSKLKKKNNNPLFSQIINQAESRTANVNKMVNRQKKEKNKQKLVNQRNRLVTEKISHQTIINNPSEKKLRQKMSQKRINNINSEIQDINRMLQNFNTI